MSIVKYANSADLTPVANFLEKECGRRNKARVFAAQGIPLDLVENRNAYIPYHDICAIYERTARLIGDPLLGARCGAQWIAGQLGPLGEYATSASTLGKCLERLTSTIGFYENGSGGLLEKQGEMVKFTYLRAYGQPLGSHHYSNANVGVLLDCIRHYTGQLWHPSQIGTDNINNQDERVLEEFLEIPVVYDQAGISITFPASELNSRNLSPVSAYDAMTLLDLKRFLVVGPPQSMTESVLEIVSMRLLGGLSDIEGVAWHLNIGVRTLQRELTIEGASYRNILAEERIRRAVHLLTETNFSITEIAISLGYDHPAAFTRAFTKYCGRPPSEVRRPQA